MAGLAHFGIGFAAKPLAPKVPVGLLVLATAMLDLLWFAFYVMGIEGYSSIPYWSHGLFMSLVWSAAGALVAAAISKSLRISLVYGLLIFSHWVLDFISHPMGAISGGKPLPPDLPLLFKGSPLVGLGLYNHSVVISYIFDFGMGLAGIVFYLIYTIRGRREKMLAAPRDESAVKG